jgi:hypothetical protein
MVSEATRASVNIGRLLVSPASEVYAELRAHDGRLESRRFHSSKELEDSLLQRGDRLIDLGLAQFCGEKSVWQAVYAKARMVGTSEQESRYLHSLRVACLANENQGRSALSPFLDTVMSTDEVKRLVLHGTHEEMEALLSNPHVDEGLLVHLLKKESVFSQLEEKRHLLLVHLASENPRLVTDTSNEHGPDLHLWDLHRAIVHLMRSAPLSMDWLLAIRALLDAVLFGDAHRPDGPIDDIIERWSTLEVDTKEREGRWSDISFRDESIVLMAALYGAYYDFSVKETKVIGDFDSLSLALRCAYYGTETLTIEQMQRAADRDKSSFVLAALCNKYLYLDDTTRKLLEQKARGWLLSIYRSRCEVLHKQRGHRFDPRPVTQELRALLAQEAPKVFAPSKESQHLDSLQVTVTRLEQRLHSMSRWILFGGIGLFAAVLLT